MKEIEEKSNLIVTKETAYRIWHAAFKDVPDNYDFIIQSHADSFKKGSQVFLCYGRMSNRDALKRYGFCLTSNKYNNMYIKLRLQQNDPEFKYRQYIIGKFFSVDAKDNEVKDSFCQDQSEEGPMDIQSRHFKIFYQKLNTKVLKFIKILTFNVKEDDIACIIESRSLSLEYLSLTKLKQVYSDFLAQFPTTLEEDMKLLRGDRKNLNIRQFFAI